VVRWCVVGENWWIFVTFATPLEWVGLSSLVGEGSMCNQKCRGLPGRGMYRKGEFLIWLKFQNQAKDPVRR
jgi:hypothetical protein